MTYVSMTRLDRFLTTLMTRAGRVRRLAKMSEEELIFDAIAFSVTLWLSLLLSTVGVLVLEYKSFDWILLVEISFPMASFGQLGCLTK
jgi:hypothetical protein